jgi:hypothetical protein
MNALLFPAAPALSRRSVLLSFASTGLLAGCGGGGSSSATPGDSGGQPVLTGPSWRGFGGNPQHTALSSVAAQPLSRIQWRAAVDLQPEYRSGDLLSHYGSPVITSGNVVILPVKTGAAGNFKLEAREGLNGALLWSAATDYVMPAHSWTPSYNPVLTLSNRVYAPDSGGRLWMRTDAGSSSGVVSSAVFYGQALYGANKAVFDASVLINTPITSDDAGNLFFGFIVTGTNPANLRSGFARVDANGEGVWVAAALASADAAIDKVAMNCAPALSPDLKTVYIAVNTAATPSTRQSGYLLALDSTSLATKARIRLRDPATGAPAWISDNATSSPTVAADGSVFYGVLESNPPAHNFRGWLLSFSADLSTTRVPGSFGWDDTASVVPISMVPGYAGPSSYLLMIKYNNYGGVGTGDGVNRLSIVDPGQSQADSISGLPVMKEILTIAGLTPDLEHPGGVKEWCINTAAVDPITRSVMVNSEDGYLYRWDLVSNSFTQKIQLTSGLGEAYTPTAIGPTGSVLAINNGVLFSVGL